MAIELRIVLIVISVLVLIYVLHKISKSKMSITDSIFWIVFALLLLLLSIFPQIGFFFAGILGIETPLNFVLLFFIALMILKLFLMSIKISRLEEKNKQMAQKIAMDEFEQRGKENE